MTSRSVGSVVTFRRPFRLGKQTEMLPAGAYRLTIEEELIEGLSFAAYHRTDTILEIPAVGTASAKKQYVHVQADELDAALERDRLLGGSEAGRSPIDP
jgi:hypothetical protein